MMYMAGFSAILGVGMGLWARQIDPLNAVLLSEIANRPVNKMTSADAQVQPQNMVQA